MDTDRIRDRVISTFEPHRLSFYCGMGLMLLVDIFMLDGWGTFYPMLVWSALFAIHFLTFRTLTVEEEWVEQRLEKVGDQPWDTGHIQEIKKNPFGRSPYRTEEGRVGERRDPPSKV